MPRATTCPSCGDPTRQCGCSPSRGGRYPKWTNAASKQAAYRHRQKRAIAEGSLRAALDQKPDSDEACQILLDALRHAAKQLQITNHPRANFRVPVERLSLFELLHWAEAIDTDASRLDRTIKTAQAEIDHAFRAEQSLLV